jgi:hypothetical protein
MALADGVGSGDMTGVIVGVRVITVQPMAVRITMAMIEVVITVFIVYRGDKRAFSILMRPQPL